ncbi:MAG: hypothetical protein RBT59_12595 [Arcobacteraceae bacterium]|jgi:hypothetical protein|nr:hypothetical protein [Arcobacteraceae bacterium]
MSTDGSREIAMQYPKVILIDNNNHDFNEAERQSMLINKAREIEGDRILFGLDADEVFSANFKETEDWKKILNSQPGDVFWFKWAEVTPNQKEYWESHYFPWMFHDDGKEPHGNYVRNMHSMRIPYPIEEKQIFYVNDFHVLHLAYLNPFKVSGKRRFYKFVDWEMNKRSVVTLSRSYAQAHEARERNNLPESYIYTQSKNSFNLFEEVDSTTVKFWHDDYIIERLKSYPTKELRKLDLWDKEFLNDNDLKDERRYIDKIIHWYLFKTRYIKDKFTIRAIDKILKLMKY